MRVTYSLNRTRGLWRAHARYVARESATAVERIGFGSDEGSIDLADQLQEWQAAGDERLWKVIISPEFGNRIDLEKLTRDVMSRMERELLTKLEWAAVAHFNTDHPHVHVALRGCRDDGRPLQLSREFVRTGIRLQAEESCTLQLGYRSQLDASEAEEREVSQCRYTSLDRLIQGKAPDTKPGGDGMYFTVSEEHEAHVPDEFKKLQAQHMHARLNALSEMGLASQVGPQTWKVRRDFEVILRAMQRIGDRQKILAAHGTLLSDPRLHLSIDARQTTQIEGRILTHGEDGANQHYVLVEGTDGRVHFVYYSLEMEEARSRGKLRTNSFVRLRRRFAGDRPVTEIDDLGDAEKLLNNRDFSVAAARRSIARGVFPVEDGWSGWLGRYQAALHQAACEMEHNAIPERKRDLER